MKYVCFRTLLCSCCLIFCVASNAQHRHRVDKSTDVVSLIPFTLGVTQSLVQRDYTGLKQLVLSEGTSVAVNYLLELSIRKDRPDGSGHHAFPSTHSAISFSAATFLQQRYGWKWGIPAYLLSSYVAWGRIYAKKHDIWDVLAGSAIGAGSAFLLTRPLRANKSLSFAPLVINEGPGFYFTAHF